jgi:hypothetical protein
MRTTPAANPAPGTLTPAVRGHIFASRFSYPNVA